MFCNDYINVHYIFIVLEIENVLVPNSTKSQKITTVLPTSGNDVPPPAQNSSNQYMPHLPIVSVSSATSSHSSKVLPSIINFISVTSVNPTNSSSQPINTNYHRSLRRILSQDQNITTSTRKFRSRYSQTLLGSEVFIMYSSPTQNI